MFARLPLSRGWKQTVVIAVFGWIYFTTEYTEYTETRRRDCRAVCVYRRWLSMSGAGLGGARLPRSRGIQRLDRRSAQQKLRTTKGSVRLSRSFALPKDRGSALQELRPPKGSVRLSRSFALPKDRRSALRELRTTKGSVRLCGSFALPKAVFGSAGASPSQKAGVRLSRSFALPKAVFGSAEASPSQRGNNVAGQSAGAYLTSR